MREPQLAVSLIYWIYSIKLLFWYGGQRAIPSSAEGPAGVKVETRLLYPKPAPPPWKPSPPPTLPQRSYTYALQHLKSKALLQIKSFFYSWNNKSFIGFCSKIFFTYLINFRTQWYKAKSKEVNALVNLSKVYRYICSFKGSVCSTHFSELPHTGHNNKTMTCH